MGRYFLDTEFIEAPGYLDLISIGIVCEDGRELYAESSEVDWSKASQWVLENVKPHLGHVPSKGAYHSTTCMIGCPKADMAYEIRQHFIRDSAPEFWGYYSDYDWVLFCWLFGRMVDLPAGFPYLCRDLRQALDERGMTHIKQPDNAPHHALTDARWIMSAHRTMRTASAEAKGGANG